MSVNGYEIRMGLLGMAKDMLYEGWHQAVDAARHNASLTSTPMQAVPPPSFAEIEKLSGELYGFVQKTGEVKPAFQKPVCTTCRSALSHLRDHPPELNRMADYLKNTVDSPKNKPLRNPVIPDDGDDYFRAT